MDQELGLASTLEALRTELEAAWRDGQGRSVRFTASEVTVTLSAVARLDKDGSGKIRWYVLEAGGGVKSGREHTQTLTLKLTPMHVDDQGRASPLQVAGDQDERGR